MVLEPAPIRIDDHQAIVPDVLELCNHVVLHACFPGPFTHGHFLRAVVMERKPVIEFRERRLTCRLPAVPLDGSAHHGPVGLVRGHRLPVFLLALPPVTIVGSSHEAHCAIACAISKKRRLQQSLSGSFNIGDHQGCDLSGSGHADSGHAAGCIQRDVGFGLDPVLLLSVFIIGRRLGIPSF